MARSLIRVVHGEIDTKVVATRLIIPTRAQPEWPPLLRIAESIASRSRQMPAHAHEGAEVLSLVIEGVATYQLGAGAAERLTPGCARLLTAPQRAMHRLSPAEGGAIRWFNLVVQLPPGTLGENHLQSATPSSPVVEVDDMRLRRLVGSSGPMVSVSGLECQEMTFPRESTTFPRIGANRKAVLYVLSGRGSVDSDPVELGDAAIVENLPGVAIHGEAGLEAILMTVPTP